jgi:flagellar basal-body rod modification protein FlgD
MDIGALTSSMDVIGQQVHHHQAKTWQATSQPGVAAAATSGTAGGGAAATAGGITTNDFLTLLVSELKNQDPTAQTDPNAYIDQLVQVNSLQQLISINQELGGISNGASSPTAQSAAISDAQHASIQTSRVE